MNWRRIVVDGTTWLYHVGSSAVAFRGPRRFVARIGDVKRLDPDTIDRGRWKRTSDGMIRPAEVAAFLQSPKGGEA